MTMRECPACAVLFEVSHSKRVVCSWECVGVWQTKRAQQRTSRRCTVCRRDLPVSAFGLYPTRNSQRKSRCLDCDAALHRVIYKHGPGPRKKTWRADTQPPEKRRARALLIQAVRKGIIERQPCEECGGKRSEAHHVDYGKPYDVRWLCRQHHARAHWRPIAPESMNAALRLALRPETQETPK